MRLAWSKKARSSWESPSPPASVPTVRPTLTRGYVVVEVFVTS